MLDRYLGIPFVFVAGHLRTKRSLPVRPERIGLLNTAAVGDTVLMSGPIADIRSAYPKAEIVFLAGPSNYEIACLLEGVDQVIKLPVFSPLATIKIVRNQRFNLLLDFGPWSRLNAIIAICSGADFIGGFRTNAQARHFGYDLFVDHSENAHELENHRGIVRALGILPSHSPSVRVSSDIRPPGTFSPTDYVVLHLWPGGSAAKLKEWPLGRWIALAEDLAADNHEVVLTGSENQRLLNDSVKDLIKASLRSRVKNLAGSSLHETVWVLSRARLVVSVDTGVMHLAAALGVPLIALHGPSSPLRWGPVSDKAVVIQPPLNGCGFLNLGFEKLRNAPACMNAITYARVKAACDTLLGRGSSRPEAFHRVPTFTNFAQPFPSSRPANIADHTRVMRSN
ncbi:MAG TPA: glycosyltransferase family 9 protein [Candidatus Binataceae bacterium]|nr:glycosyltransferase family 9 protein [Candidatus Binataceae bacterium]